MPGSFRKLIRSLRKAEEDLRNAGHTVIVHEDCCECGSRVAFEFLNVPRRQTAHAQCWKCEETLRLTRTIKTSGVE